MEIEAMEKKMFDRMTEALDRGDFEGVTV